MKKKLNKKQQVGLDRQEVWKAINEFHVTFNNLIRILLRVL